MTDPQASPTAPIVRRPIMPRAGVTGSPLPTPVATALRRAHQAELTAVGDKRRPAFRLTRSLIGGARSAGFSAGDLARCLDVSVQSIRTRGGSDGWISAEVFSDLTGLEAGSVKHWEAEGLLSNRTVDEGGRACYLASDLVRALAGAERPAT